MTSSAAWTLVRQDFAPSFAVKALHICNSLKGLQLVDVDEIFCPRYRSAAPTARSDYRDGEARLTLRRGEIKVKAMVRSE